MNKILRGISIICILLLLATTAHATLSQPAVASTSCVVVDGREYIRISVMNGNSATVDAEVRDGSSSIVSSSQITSKQVQTVDVEKTGKKTVVNMTFRNGGETITRVVGFDEGMFRCTPSSSPTATATSTQTPTTTSTTTVTNIVSLTVVNVSCVTINGRDVARLDVENNNPREVDTDFLKAGNERVLTSARIPSHRRNNVDVPLWDEKDKRNIGYVEVRSKSGASTASTVLSIRCQNFVVLPGTTVTTPTPTVTHTPAPTATLTDIEKRIQELEKKQEKQQEDISIIRRTLNKISEILKQFGFG